MEYKFSLIFVEHMDAYKSSVSNFINLSIRYKVVAACLGFYHLLLASSESYLQQSEAYIDKLVVVIV